MTLPVGADAVCLQAKRLWALTEEERVEVEVEGKRGWMLETDLPLLESLPPESPSIQLLGPHDPFLDLPQRGWILPDKIQHRRRSGERSAVPAW